MVALSLAVLAAAPWIGPPVDPETRDFVLWQLRVPRVLVGALVGSTLGLVGAVYQALFDNPLATPSTTGTTAGAALGALAALVLLPDARVAGSGVVALSAFVGASLANAAVAALAAGGRARIEDVLLAGVGLTLGASALTTGLQVQADMAATFKAVRWSLGSLGQVGYDGVAWLLPVVVLTQGILFGHLRALEVLVGGEARAHSQGVDVVRTRTALLGAGALGVGACVAWAGPIAFVGLVVPHLVRLGVGARRRVLLPLSSLVGASFLVGCDAAARTLLGGRELPVGVLTAALGAPLLVFLVVRRRVG